MRPIRLKTPISVPRLGLDLKRGDVVEPGKDVPAALCVDWLEQGRAEEVAPEKKAKAVKGEEVADG